MKKIILLFTSIVLLNSCSQDAEEYTVERKDIVESVYSSVSVQPRSIYKVYAQTPGQIIQFNKNVGDSIQFGETICLIDAISAETSRKNAALSYQLAQSQLTGDANLLQELQYEIDLAKEQNQLDSINFERIKTLNQRGASSDLELEQAQLKFENGKIRYKSLLSKKQRSAKELKIQSQQAENIYLNNLASSSDAQVKSILTGTIYDLFKESGELVLSHEPIALVGTSNEFDIHLLIDEMDITKVTIGQQVVVDLEAYPDTLFEATITRIYPSMKTQSQSFEVIAQFVQQPPRLYNGLTGEANIIISERKNVVVIPRKYLLDQHFIQTKEDKIEVTTGLKNLEEIEITTGLKEGAKIILPN